MADSRNQGESKRLLRKFGEFLLEEVLAAKASGEVIVRRQQYFRRRNLNLWYSDEPIVLNDSDVETTEEEELDSKNIEQFIERHIAQAQPYKDVLKALQPHEGAVHLLRPFTWRLVQSGVLALDPELESCLEIIMRDLNDSPRDYRAKLFLTGIKLTEDRIDVSDELSLRRPDCQDLIERVRVQDVHYPPGATGGKIHFSCIAECRIQTNGPVGIQIYADRLGALLRLFRLGSVSTSRIEYRGDSFSSFANGIFGFGQRAPRMSYTLLPENVEDLRRALTVILPSLPSDYGPGEKKLRFLSTALSWYEQSLLGGGSIEGTIASAVACLEALFLAGGITTEIAYRLQNRVISMLRCFGFGSLEMRKVLKSAYDVRSRHVHGDEPKNIKHEELVALHRHIADYARASSLAWAQVQIGKRADFISLLDDALLDETANEKLKQRCADIEFVRPSEASVLRN